MRRCIRYAIAAALCMVSLTTATTATTANDCVQRCVAQENACRRQTKDAPKCGTDLTRCLQGCRAQR